MKTFTLIGALTTLASVALATPAVHEERQIPCVFPGRPGCPPQPSTPPTPPEQPTPSWCSTGRQSLTCENPGNLGTKCDALTKKPASSDEAIALCAETGEGCRPKCCFLGDIIPIRCVNY